MSYKTSLAPSHTLMQGVKAVLSTADFVLHGISGAGVRLVEHPSPKRAEQTYSSELESHAPAQAM